MKRIISVLLLVCILTLCLTSCGTVEIPQITNVDEATASTDSRNLRKYSNFITEFKYLVSKLPEYNIVQLNDVPLDDGSTCHVFYINDTMLDDKYRLRVDTNSESEITWVLLSGERKSYGNLQFAVFSSYAYQAMGFPVVDADSFYDKYDLFSKDKIFVSDMYEDYEITSMTIDGTLGITFSIRIPTN